MKATELFRNYKCLPGRDDYVIFNEDFSCEEGLHISFNGEKLVITSRHREHLFLEHELGHILVCDDDDLFKENLGMGGLGALLNITCQVAQYLSGYLDKTGINQLCHETWRIELQALFVQNLLAADDAAKQEGLRHEFIETYHPNNPKFSLLQKHITEKSVRAWLSHINYAWISDTWSHKKELIDARRALKWGV